MRPYYTRKVSLFKRYSIGFESSNPQVLSADVLGGNRIAYCPICYSTLPKWLNWFEAKEYDADLWAVCEKGHTIPEDYIVVKVFPDEVDRIIAEENAKPDDEILNEQKKARKEVE